MLAQRPDGCGSSLSYYQGQISDFQNAEIHFILMEWASRQVKDIGKMVPAVDCYAAQKRSGGYPEAGPVFAETHIP